MTARCLLMTVDSCSCNYRYLAARACPCHSLPEYIRQPDITFGQFKRSL